MLDFQFGYHGTSVEKLLVLFTKDLNNLVVYDKSKFYGTTTTVLGLSSSAHIKNLNITKMTISECLIETSPQLFTSEGKILCELQKSNILAYIDFVEISDHLYINADLSTYRLPYNDFEILNSTWLKTHEKCALYNYMHNDLQLTTHISSLSDESAKIFGNLMSVLKINDFIDQYKLLFGRQPFLYPIYGEREISDQLSRMLALRGVSFYVDEKLECYKNDNNYEIIGPHGKANFSKLVSESEDKTYPPLYFKVLLLNRYFLSPRFFGIVKIGETTINIISLDSVAKVCPENTFLVYFYAHTELPGDVISRLSIKPENILNEIDFCNNKE